MSVVNSILFSRMFGWSHLLLLVCETSKEAACHMGDLKEGPGNVEGGRGQQNLKFGGAPRNLEGL